MLNSTNLLTQKLNTMNVAIPQQPPVTKPVDSPNPALHGNLLSAYLNTLAMINTPVVKQAPKTIQPPYKNDLRSLMMNNEAKILAIIPRTFNAKDTDGNDFIDHSEQHGTFLNAVERLDEVKSQGYNTLHILPVNTPGKSNAMGTAGSVYSPKDLLEIDPKLADPNDPRPIMEQFRTFIDECHKRGIRVMLDLPSCASEDMFNAKPELMAIESDGLAKTPQGWKDIKMFQPWEDEGKRTLNPKLLELHKQFVDMCIDLGIDGIRADVARAKPVEFWDVIIPYSHKRDPQFGWLAETYTHEDASPQANMPADRPEDSLRAGFDMIYGQYHIFHEYSTATEFLDYVKQNLKMSYRLPKGKSLIGSFATHDDISPMFHGGADYCKMTSVLQATLPMLNPYFVDGFQSGDYYLYKYGNKILLPELSDELSDTGNSEMTVHNGKMDIFNMSRKPGGDDKSIGEFNTACFKVKDKYSDIINKGSLIELDKIGDKNDQIIAYARHYEGKTLLVIANKNINRSVACKIKIPTLKASQELDNLVPSYGKESILQVSDNILSVELGAGRAHIFEIDTPNIENYTNKIFKQNL